MLKKHYHWIVCIACTLLVFCNMGLCSTIITVYLPFIEAQGISGAMGSAIISVRCISSFICTFIVALFFDRISLRSGTALATLLGAVGYIIFAAGGSIFAYYAGSVIFGIAYCFGCMIPVSLIITNWFSGKKALALGICTTGSGFSTMIFAPLMTSIITKHGLRTAFIFAAVFIAVCAAVTFTLIRNTPEDLSLKPYGTAETAKEVRYSDRKHGPTGFEYFIMAVMMIVMGGAAIGYSSHISILITTNGYSHETAALSVSLFGVMLIIGKLIFGQVADRLRALKTSAIFLCTFVVGCLPSIFMDGKNMLMCFALPVLLGLGSPVYTIGPSLWSADLASKEYYAKVLQWLLIFYNLGGIMFTSVPGIIADHTGEYVTSFIMFAAMAAVTMILLIWCYASAKKHARAGR
ncbi:MAG: MFS transporter [Erysipelotrichaceae bacterium]|nr:MFS transporter [Erysipelotrichaceae bacterium]